MVLAVLSLVFGGASRENELRLALVELASVPLLAFSLHRLIDTGRWREVRLPLGILSAVLLIPLLQLVPLPHAWWARLPGRDQVDLALQLGGVDAAWLPMSMAPEKTWASFLALLPPAAMMLATLLLRTSQQRRMTLIFLLGAVASVLLGAAQLAAGGRGPLYLYETTTLKSAVGFFANRNHLAALLVATLPLAGVFVGEAIGRARGDRRMQIALGLLFSLLVVVGIGAVQSRAGIMLAGPALLGSLLVAWRASSKGHRALAAVSLVLVGATAAAAVAVFSLSPILQRFDSEGSERRFEDWAVIADAAETYLPVGTGMGSFDPVYRSVEPLDTMGAAFLNHAHNDFLETWLEAGWLGALVLVVFLGWWGFRSWRAWMAESEPYGSLARAAGLSIGLLLLHSLGDYPLRTETLAVFFAFCCGILAARPMPRDPLPHA